MNPEPLQFIPRLMEKPWGGRRLEAVLGRVAPPGTTVGESWEISALSHVPTPVRSGPDRGRILPELTKNAGWAAEVLGTEWVGHPFPLLFKFLDVEDRLSVQVHTGKTETWIILASDPEAHIWRGWKESVTEDDVRRAIAAGRLPERLHEFHPKPGDVIHIPSGVVHAAGGGLLVAEIQQAADVTWRLFDWTRSDRALHVEEALRAIAWGGAGPERVMPHAECQPGGEIERLIDGPFYALERRRITTAMESAVDPARFELLVVLEGAGRMRWRGGERALSTGDSLLLPATLGTYVCDTNHRMVVLNAHPIKPM